MKKIRHIGLVFLSLILCLALSGCAQITNNVKIYPDGDYSSYIKVIMENDIFDKASLDVEECRSLIAKQFEIEDQSRIVEISETHNDIEYIGFEYVVDKSPVTDKMNVSVEADKLHNVITFKLTNKLSEDIFFDSINFGSDQNVDMQSIGLSYTLFIEMPGKIISSTEGKIDGDLVEIDFFEWDNDELIIVSDINSNLVTLLTIAFCLVLIIIILLVILKIHLQAPGLTKRQKKKTPVSNFKIEIEQENDILKTLNKEKENTNDWEL